MNFEVGVSLKGLIRRGEDCDGAKFEGRGRRTISLQKIVKL